MRVGKRSPATLNRPGFCQEVRVSSPGYFSGAQKSISKRGRDCSSVNFASLQCRSFCAIFEPRARKIELEDPRVTHSATRHNVRTLLAQTEPVSESAAAELERVPMPRDLKPRAFQKIPPKRPTHYNLEVPAAHLSSAFTFDQYPFCSTGSIAPLDS